MRKKGQRSMMPKMISNMKLDKYGEVTGGEMDEKKRLEQAYSKAVDPGSFRKAMGYPDSDPMGFKAGRKAGEAEDKKKRSIMDILKELLK